MVSQNFLHFLDHTHIAVIQAGAFLVEIRSDKEAIEFLELERLEVVPLGTALPVSELVHEASEQIVLVIQGTSLVVNTPDFVFKDILITLVDVGNQEITQNNEQEENDNHEEKPGTESE